MELIPIGQTPEENEAFAGNPSCSELLEMTMGYYKIIGFHPPWTGYFAREEEHLVGTAGYKGTPKNGRVEIAYSTLEGQRQKGVGTRICQKLVEIALKADPFVQITARTLPLPNYSTRILEKNGFVLLGNVEDKEDGIVWEWKYIRPDPDSKLEFIILETERLILKPTTEADAEFIISLLNSPTFLHHIGDRKVRTIEDAKKYIEERIDKQRLRLGYSNYTIVRKADGEKLGTCGLYARPDVEGVDIGYALLPSHEKQGYAFEAATGIMEAALNKFKIPKVNAYTTRENKGSQKILEKLGMKFIKYTYLPNDPEELLMYQTKNTSRP